MLGNIHGALRFWAMLPTRVGRIFRQRTKSTWSAVPCSADMQKLRCAGEKLVEIVNPFRVDQKHTGYTGSCCVACAREEKHTRTKTHKCKTVVFVVGKRSRSSVWIGSAGRQRYANVLARVLCTRMWEYYAPIYVYLCACTRSDWACASSTTKPSGWDAHHNVRLNYTLTQASKVHLYIPYILLYIMYTYECRFAHKTSEN